MNFRKVFLTLAGISVAGVVGAYALQAQAVNALSVGCSGAVATSTVAWTASPQGGVAPYTLLWSGASIGGATTSPVYQSYGVGIYTARIRVTDASSTVATSSCSATVAPVIVHLPPYFKSPHLVINPGGEFTGRGMIVTSITGDSFKASVWGTSWTVIASSSPEFLLRGGQGGGKFDMDQLQVGDEVGVAGTLTGTTTLTVNARIVRDYSIQVLRPKAKNHDDDNRNFDQDAIRNQLNDQMKSLKDRLKEMQDKMKELKDNH